MIEKSATMSNESFTSVVLGKCNHRNSTGFAPIKSAFIFTLIDHFIELKRMIENVYDKI